MGNKRKMDDESNEKRCCRGWSTCDIGNVCVGQWPSSRCRVAGGRMRGSSAQINFQFSWEAIGRCCIRSADINLKAHVEHHIDDSACLYFFIVVVVLMFYFLRI